MTDLQEILWGFSIVSLAIYFLQSLTRAISKAFVSLNRLLSSSLLSPLFSKNLFLDCSESRRISFKQEENPKENSHSAHKNRHCMVESRGLLQDKNLLHENYGFSQCSEKRSGGLINEGSSSSSGMAKIGVSTNSVKLKKRPSRLVVPEFCPALEFGESERNAILQKKEFEVAGRDFYLISKKGRRELMEDKYGVMTDILGDPKQAFFAVIDGHGGCAAADYVAENLGKNIVKAMENVEDEGHLEQAILGGYLATDKDFLSLGIGSGACAASVFLKDGMLLVANVGDCKVVLSRKGVADPLTNDHRLSRADERQRIEDSGGFVHCRNGVWRVQGSLAVSRAMGDLHLKEWVVSEPEMTSLPLTSDCQFLIIASDGLWEKVNEQEAVNVVSKDERDLQESCRKLVEISCRRGNVDDITVMVINLDKFV